MSTPNSGHGVQVVSPSGEHTFLLDEESLQALLLQDDMRDRAVVLVSVAGAYRKGKSFLLDFFLRYLNHVYNKGGSEDDWLGAEDATLKGFSWRGGSDRHTTGIHLWSQPFKATLDNGDKVVILLMDTQGTFDSESTVKDNATVFALSTMLSSVQIYNLSQNIEEDDLQHLQLFMDYGCVAKDKIAGKPFQKLLFLVRDWSYPYNHKYGAAGGQELLEKRLQVQKGQHDELLKLREHISRCFEEVSCFLMPHPGLRVARDQDFTGKLSDIEPEFKVALKELAPQLLAKRNLVPKVIDGQKVKARDLVNYFHSYIDIFNSEELPEPTTILRATAEANNRSAMSEACDIYKALMEEICGGSKPYLPSEKLEAEHWKVMNKAIHAFDSKKKMGGEEMAENFRKELVQELEQLYSSLAAHNDGKNMSRMIATPVVFLTLVVLGYLVQVAGSMVGIQTVVFLGQVATFAAVVMLGLWLYTRLTGTMREVGMELDNIAMQLRFLVHRQAFSSITQPPSEETPSTHNDDKKHS